MIQKFVTRFDAQREALTDTFSQKHPSEYKDIVKAVISAIADGDDYGESPDPERITEIDHGDYQGTKLFVVAANGYQPSTFWYVRVWYGSCGGCDTLQRIRDYGDYDTPPSETQVKDYMTLALHIVQGLHRCEEDAL